MSNKIVCKHETGDLTLDCSKLELNLFRILKLLNEVSLLPIMFPQRHPPEKVEKVEKVEKPEKIPAPPQTPEAAKQAQTKKNHQHELSTMEALNVIWYSAYMCKTGAVVPYQLLKLSKNKLVGEKSEIDQVIESIEEKIETLKKSTSEKRHALLEEANRKLIRASEIKKMIYEKWSQLREKYPAQSPLAKKLSLGPFGLEINPQHKHRLCSFVRKHLVKSDTKILQESIMFIQEIEDGHCVVSVQQCYPSFMVYKELLKSLIGKQHYYKGLKQMMLCKEQSFKEGRPFMPQKYVMCHICKKIELMDQVKKRPTEMLCTFNTKQPDIYSTSHAFEELCLKINYHNLPLKSLSDTEIKECYGQSKQFQSYVHPYTKVYYPQCSRYYCQSCFFALKEQKRLRKQKNAKKKQKEDRQDSVKLQENAESIKSQENTQNQTCVFCLKSCNCDRCTLAQNFKKLLAVYNSLGGSFQDLAPELMFINLYCTRVHIQLVTFDQGSQRQEQNSEENRVQLQKTDQDTLSYPEQVVKLEGWFSKLCDKQRVKLYGQESVYGDRNDDCESVDENQIFPELQDMYNRLLKEQQQRQYQVKIAEEDESEMTKSKKSKQKVSEYDQSEDQT